MSFIDLEKGTDNTFDNLSNEAKAICFNTWERVKDGDKPLNVLTRELDRSNEFRRAIGCLNHDVLPQQTDVVIRYFKWRLENEQN